MIGDGLTDMGEAADYSTILCISKQRNALAPSLLLALTHTHTHFGVGEICILWKTRERRTAGIMMMPPKAGRDFLVSFS